MPPAGVVCSRCGGRYEGPHECPARIRASPPDARTVIPGQRVTYSNRRQLIPVVKSPVNDLEALEHARKCVNWRQDHIAQSLVGNGYEDPLDSRALSELDRLIDQARRAR